MAIDHLVQEASQDNGQALLSPPLEPVRPAVQVPLAAPPMPTPPPSLPVQVAQSPPQQVYVPVMMQPAPAPAPAPGTRWQRGRKVAAAAPTAQAPSRRTLETMFPQSAPDRVLVSWLNPDTGRLTTIKSYPRHDVEQFASLEEFLERVVVPTYRRYGDFYVKWVAADGGEREATASILEPASEDGARTERASSPIGLLTGLLRDTWERRQQGQPVDPGVARVVDEVQRELGGGNAGAVLARLDRLERQATSGGQQMSTMEADLMRRLIDQVEQLTREQQQARATAALPVLPAADPAQAAREAVREAVADLRQSQQSPPDPIALVDRMMGSFKTLMETLRPAVPIQQAEEPRVKAMEAQIEKLTGELERTRREQQEERMKAIEKGLAESAARQEELVRELRAPPEQEKFADRLREVREVASELSGLSGVTRTTPGTAADALRDIVHSVPEILRESQRTIDKLRDRDAAAAERSAEARRAVAEKRAWEARREQQVRQQRQQQERREPSAQVKASGQAAAEPRPEFPVGFGAHMRAFADAKTDADMVRATLGAFQYLAREVGQPWAPYWDATVSAMRARDREALSYLDAILENFEKSGAITADARRRASSACARGFDRIVDALFPREPQAQEAN